MHTSMADNSILTLVKLAWFGDAAPAMIVIYVLVAPLRLVSMI